MIGYVMLGSNDFERAKAFYDAVMPLVGAKRTFGDERSQGYGGPGEGPMLAVCRPFDGQPATHGNGTMIALVVGSRAIVDQAHAGALAAGGTDEGEPGVRGGDWYGAYFRDPDGNKLCVYHDG